MSSLQSSSSILSGSASTDSLPASWKPLCGVAAGVGSTVENVSDTKQTQSVDMSVKDRRLAFARLMPLDIGHDANDIGYGDMDTYQVR